jgi:hypothetical protein
MYAATFHIGHDQRLLNSLSFLGIITANVWFTDLKDVSMFILQLNTVLKFNSLQREVGLVTDMTDLYS